MCHIIFAGKEGISSNMAPEETVDKIENSLVWCTVSSIYDNKTDVPLYLILLPFIIFVKFSHNVV